MTKLFRYLKKYRKESILAPFFKLIEVAFELTVPLIVSNIIDVGIENGDKGYIVKRCLLLGLLGILGLCSTLVAQYFSAKPSGSLPTYATRCSVTSVSSHTPSSTPSARRLS